TATFVTLYRSLILPTYAHPPFLHLSAAHRHPHSFPTRRSSDLAGWYWRRRSAVSPSSRDRPTTGRTASWPRTPEARELPGAAVQPEPERRRPPAPSRAKRSPSRPPATPRTHPARFRTANPPPWCTSVRTANRPRPPSPPVAPRRATTAAATATATATAATATATTATATATAGTATATATTATATATATTATAT